MSLTRINMKQVKQARDILIEQQQGLCAICRQPFNDRDKAVLDHDHYTGLVRGVIHISCNGAEGQLIQYANRGHKGVKPYPFLIGLGFYLYHHSVPKTHMIHPSHHCPNERKGVSKKKRNWRT